MRVRAQYMMVMALDKCVGCHTCSITCKQVWTDRPGAEYIWFNNVETRPGTGYPRRWEDDLAGTLTSGDPKLSGLERDALLRYEDVFLFYLPRICNHCVNPSCVASCPSGAMYKREEDGIVLVDQDACRGWRFCVSGCPYKKTYFDHLTGKAEKCIFCYPLTENGRPTVCSETCVGRLRYLGVALYDLDAVTATAETPRAQGLVEAQRELLLDPHDARVAAAARESGVPHAWLEAARRSPTYALAKELRVALPLHPEYRTLPMVWYVPPLSPALDSLSAAGYQTGDPDEVFPALGDLRVPARFVAAFLAAGDAAPVEESLRRQLAVRLARRRLRLGQAAPTAVLDAAGLTEAEAERLFELLGLAEYGDRYVLPRARHEAAGARQARHGARPRPEEATS